jgi:ribosomal protein S18 acetylase RimI-like enzyme
MGKGNDPNCASVLAGAMVAPSEPVRFVKARAKDLAAIEPFIDPDDVDMPDSFPLKMGLESGRLYRVERSGQTVGMIRTDSWPEEDGMVMDPWMWVHPHFRRQGVGQQMLAQLADIPHHRGCPLRVTVREINQPSCAMVEKAGWKLVEIIRSGSGRPNPEIDRRVYVP